jgi:predicted transcriptional regulator
MGSVAKRSISVPVDVWRKVQAAAEEEHTTVSAFITEALENLISIREGLRGVRAWEREHGALTAEELAEADALLDAIDRRAQQ